MNPIPLEEIKARAERAQTGPWTIDGDFLVSSARDDEGDATPIADLRYWHEFSDLGFSVMDNARHVVACDPPTILAWVAEHQADKAALAEALEHAAHWERKAKTLLWSLEQAEAVTRSADGALAICKRLAEEDKTKISAAQSRIAELEAQLAEADGLVARMEPHFGGNVTTDAEAAIQRALTRHRARHKESAES